VYLTRTDGVVFDPFDHYAKTAQRKEGGEGK
jgi:hypothetical protein